MSNKGFIKLNRKSFAHKFWTKARVLSEFEAWIDLIQSARFDEAVTIEYIDGREIKYGRGQYPASIRFLAKKWNWGEQKVRSFLNELKRDGSITTDSSQGMNIITLCKYDKYNSGYMVDNTANNTLDNTYIQLILSELKDLKTHVSTQSVTQLQHSGNTNNKKVNKENNIIKEISTNVDIKKTSLSDYEKFNHRLIEECDNVCKLSKQMTEQEFNTLLSKYSKKDIWEIIEAMQNKKDLTKKYTSVYLTANRWLKREKDGTITTK